MQKVNNNKEPQATKFAIVGYAYILPMLDPLTTKLGITV